MKTAKAILKLFLFTLITIILVPHQLVVLCFTKGPAAYNIPFWWHKSVCRIIGLKVNIIGAPAHYTQTAFVGNHLSYLDILCLGQTLKASFVAKEDVANWPVFGFLSKVQQTAFISRSRQQAVAGKNNLLSMLDQSKSIILFPEGRSTDGQTVLPFKSSLFSIFFDDRIEKPIVIQPFTISIGSADGQAPQTQKQRDHYSWHGDMTLAPHLWAFFKSKGAVINIEFHDLIHITNESDRKSLAHQSFQASLSGLTPHHDKNAVAA